MERFTSLSLSSLILFSLLLFQFSSSAIQTLNKGESLSVENPEDILLSPNGIFSAGFQAVGANTYCFSVWFTENPTLVWTANRDQPVNGKRSTLFLLKTGNLLLTDADEFNVWTSGTSSSSSVELLLYDTGNLVLSETEGGVVLWQSFDFPTDTLLPQQQFNRFTKLISSRSDTNHSSGFYSLFFDNENILRLLYDGPEISSVYWPDPWLLSWEVGRTTYNASRIAMLDSLGNFSSSDELRFTTSDYGTVLQRRLKIDSDGNVRVYSRKSGTEKWYVSWQAISKPCTIHGICGANSLCSYDPVFGRKCSCLPGFQRKNVSDWSLGCEPKHNFSCNPSESYFLRLPYVDFYGYDREYTPNSTLEYCLNLTLQSCDYKGFQYKFSEDDGYFKCFPKTLLMNGYISPDLEGAIYLRVPKTSSSSMEESLRESSTVCPNETITPERAYVKRNQNGKVKLVALFAYGIGGLEVICILWVWGFLRRSRRQSDAQTQGYLPVGSGIRKYSYSELEKATRGFRQEIGRGGGGIVYKGELGDHGVAAIKRLNEANQGEEEFLAEVSNIGMLNHMNLIKMWGYCAEGKHRLLVYEFIENGSLAEILGSKSHALDFNTRFNIALGMARGLAYLHEECLEWILHCDVKPQNILLDSNYQPKVADFGLSKLLKRDDFDDSKFSRIRGTRGYMAPEWVFNLPITSKVDVYSYGIVVLEMVTGQNPTMGGNQGVDGREGMMQHRLAAWVREKRSKASSKASWLKQIMDPMIEGSLDSDKMVTLVEVALQCVEEDRDTRPTMRKVVEMLQSRENDSP